MSIQLQEGKWYMTRDGQVAGPMTKRLYNNGDYPFQFPQRLNGHLVPSIVRANGSYLSVGLHQCDFVREIEAPASSTTKGDDMSTKAFDFDAFNKVLQGSTAICAKGRADINAAISAGKGEPEPIKPRVGIWRTKQGKLRIMVRAGTSAGYMTYDEAGDRQLDNESVVDFAKCLYDYGYQYVGPLSDIKV